MSAIGNIIDDVTKIKNLWGLDQDVYFRGQRSRHTLLPSLLRMSNCSKETDEMENNFFCDAWVMAASELSQTSNSWEALALFQHYQIPTRLLDWSSSLISAIFFAISDCLSCENYNKKEKCFSPKENCKGNPVIWILNPYAMHHVLHQDTMADDTIAFTVGIDLIQDYKEEFVVKSGSNWKYKNGPIFLEIPWKNPRIKAQKGFFTFHPTEEPLEKLLTENEGLVKIEISRNDITDLINEFETAGLNEHDFYSDIGSLGQFLKRRYSL